MFPLHASVRSGNNSRAKGSVVFPGIPNVVTRGYVTVSMLKSNSRYTKQCVIIIFRGIVLIWHMGVSRSFVLHLQAVFVVCRKNTKKKKKKTEIITMS